VKYSRHAVPYVKNYGPYFGGGWDLRIVGNDSNISWNDQLE
jgi:hypothetical protein